MSYASSVSEAANIVFSRKTKGANICFYHLTMFISLNKVKTCRFNVKMVFFSFTDLQDQPRHSLFSVFVRLTASVRPRSSG